MLPSLHHWCPCLSRRLLVLLGLHAADCPPVVAAEQLAASLLVANLGLFSSADKAWCQARPSMWYGRHHSEILPRSHGHNILACLSQHLISAHDALTDPALPLLQVHLSSSNPMVLLVACNMKRCP
jgi:hypothetical protein